MPNILYSALRELLPVAVACASVQVPEVARFEFQAEANSVRLAGDSRRCEFLAGRQCARAALKAIGFQPCPLPADVSGLPRWPDGALASISHSKGQCLAVAAKSSDYRLLGLDLEKTNRLSPSAIKRTVRPEEQVYVQGGQKRASLIFSAKEAFYKAQFPRWRRQANFHDLQLAVDEEASSLKIQWLDPRFPEELCRLAPMIEFRFRYVEDYVLSACWLEG